MFDHLIIIFILPREKIYWLYLIKKKRVHNKIKKKSFFLLDTIIIHKNYRSLKLGSKLIKDINTFIFKKELFLFYIVKRILLIFIKKIIERFAKKEYSFLFS